MEVKALKDFTLLCVSYKKGETFETRKEIAVDLQEKGFAEIISDIKTPEKELQKPVNKEKATRKRKTKELDI